MQRVIILAIGDELALGERLDTNSPWIAEQLARHGADILEQRTVPDDQALIASALCDSAGRANLIIATGGLGPTKDDLTRFALGDVLAPDDELVQDDDAVRQLRARYAKAGRVMPESNLVQALRPRAARFLSNPRGTAMGLAANVASGTMIFTLPGPPREMKPMFEAEVLPIVQRDASSMQRRTIAVRACSLSESEAAERLGPLMDRAATPQVGITVTDTAVSALIRALGDPAEIEPQIERVAQQIEQRWHPHVYGRDDATIAHAVAAMLIRHDRTLATAESCTGGLVGEMLTMVSGVSACYLGGWITYSNDMKRDELGVPEETLREHGAVSAETARAMAIGALQRSGATSALSITGIAGPDGGSAEKPVGTVFIAAALQRRNADEPIIDCRRFRFPGDRALIRTRSACNALQMLRLLLMGEHTPLLWEVHSDTAALVSGGASS